MSKRISLTIATPLYDELRAFADKDSRSVQSLLIHAAKAHLSRRRKRSEDESGAPNGSFDDQGGEGGVPVQGNAPTAAPSGGQG